jgi:hypothetical protein
MYLRLIGDGNNELSLLLIPLQRRSGDRMLGERCYEGLSHLQSGARHVITERSGLASGAFYF